MVSVRDWLLVLVRGLKPYASFFISILIPVLMGMVALAVVLILILIPILIGGGGPVRAAAADGPSGRMVNGPPRPGLNEKPYILY